MKKRAAKAAAPEPEPQAGPMYTTVYYAVPPDDDPSDALTTEETIELVGAGVIVDSTKVWAEGDDGSMDDWEEFGLVKQQLGFPERDGGTQSGWLEKKGSFRAPWSRVYCILYPGSTPPRIGHYEAVDAAAEAGMLELSTCSAIRPSTAETAGECEFEVVSEQKGTQRLRAPSAEAMEAWLAALAPFATAKPKGKRERMHSRALAKVRPSLDLLLNLLLDRLRLLLLLLLLLKAAVVLQLLADERCLLRRSERARKATSSSTAWNASPLATAGWRTSSRRCPRRRSSSA